MDDRRAVIDLTALELAELVGIGKILAKLKTIGANQTAIAHSQTAAARTLARILAAITAGGVTMSEIDDRLAALTAEVADVGTVMAGAAETVERVVADLRADLAEALDDDLTDEQAAKFDTIGASLAELKTSAEKIQQLGQDAAEPAPADDLVQPTPVNEPPTEPAV